MTAAIQERLCCVATTLAGTQCSVRLSRFDWLAGYARCKIHQRGATPKAIEVLSFIYGTLVAGGHPPTIREIAAHLGITSTNAVNDHLVALDRHGLIERVASRSRGTRITPHGFAALNVDAPSTGGKWPDRLLLSDGTILERVEIING